MPHTQKLVLGFAASVATFALVAAVPTMSNVTAAALRPYLASTAKVPATGLDLTAERLQKRLKSQYNLDVPLARLRTAVTERRAAMLHATTVSFMGDDGTTFDPWQVSLQEYPQWMRAKLSVNFGFSIDTSAVQESLHQLVSERVPAPASAVLLSTHEDRTVLKADTDGIAKPGYALDETKTAADIGKALTSGAQSMVISLRYEPGKIENATNQDFGELTLLATGRSNFAGSGDGRKANVRKGLQQHLHNTFVAPGETFSFNNVLNNMKGGGWELALGIFNGNQLRMVPGGGICQVATTMYRSVVNAGLPIVKRANHSLYVTYYEKYGVGIDATIFPGAQDLTFLNDTGNYLLIQSYTDGYDAYVQLYGTPDGRMATLDGPYFASTAPMGVSIKSNEIVWLQTVRFADGHETQNIIRSRYNSIPRSVVQKYTTGV